MKPGLSPGELLLYKVHKQLYSGQDTLSAQLLGDLGDYVSHITKRQRRPAAPRPRFKSAAKPEPVVEEVYLRKLKARLWNDEEFLQRLGAYLDLPSVARLSQVCLTFNAVYRTAWPLYIALEYDHIEAFLESHLDECRAYLGQVQQQIPATDHNWLHLTYDQIIYALTRKFTKKEITELKTLKKLPAEYDEVFRPFTYLLDRNPSRLKTAEGALYNKYSDVVLKLICDKAIKRMLWAIPKELIAEKAVMQAINAFNSPLLQDSVVRTLSPALANFVEWGRALVAYHVITHPFRLRVKSGLSADMVAFAVTADERIQNYYRAKRGLLTAGLLPREQEYDLTFRLPEIPSISEAPSLGLQVLSEDLLSKSVLTYLDVKSLHSVLLVSQHTYRAVSQHWHPRLISLLIDFERFKLENVSLLQSSSEPAHFACYLNPAVLLLDEVLNSPLYLQLLVSKQLVDQLRSLKSLTPPVALALDAVCELLSLKPSRVKTAKGEVEVRYPHSQLFFKYNLVTQAENIMKRVIPSATLSTVEGMLSNCTEVSRSNSEAGRLALWAQAVVLLRKMSNPLLFLDCSSFTSDENRRFTAKWFLTEIRSKLNTISCIRTHPLASLTLRELVQRAKEQLREEDSHFRASEYEQILQLNPTSEVIARLHQKFLSAAPQTLTCALLEECMTTLISEVDLPPVQGSHDQQMAIQRTGRYTPLVSPTNKRLSEGNNTARSIVSLLYRSTEAIPSSTVKLKTAPGQEFPVEALPLSILYFLPLRDLYMSCSMVNRPWSNAVKLHSGLRLHFELSRLDQLIAENTYAVQEFLQRRKVYEERNEAPRPTEDQAGVLIRAFKQRDVDELKRIAKPLAVYNDLVAPFVAIMDAKPKRRKRADGQVELNYWEAALQMLMKSSISRRMEAVPLTSMSWRKAEEVESLLDKASMPLGSAAGVGQSIGNLLSWVTGVWQYHLSSRRYYATLAERKYLTDQLVTLCRVLDDCDRANFLLYDYINRCCDDEEYRQFTEEVLRGRD